jgi:hypothetical protein
MNDSTQRPSTSVVTPLVSPNTARPNIPSEFRVTGYGLSWVTQVEAVEPSGTNPVTATNLKIMSDNLLTCRFELPAGTWQVRVRFRSDTADPIIATPYIDVK